MYKSYGKDKLKISVANMKYWKSIKDNIARILRPRGRVICCGWNTNGLGKGRGFEMTDILVVSHGGSKNDTLVTLEYKIGETQDETGLSNRQMTVFDFIA